MSTPEKLCNLALAKLGLTGRIATLASPTDPLTKHFYAIYAHYRDLELTRRRWLFAKHIWTLTQSLELSADEDHPFRYEMPAEMLKPWRDRDSEWIIAGREIWSGYPETLTVTGTQRAPENLFDPMFDEVLIVRLAIETLDYPGVSAEKRQDTSGWYQRAVNDAAANNAFLHEADNIADDNQFDWLTARTAV